MKTPLTRQQGRALTRLILMVLGAFLCLIGYVFYQSYQGREDVVRASRKGCERGKKDRSDNAEGWRAAEAARLASLAKERHISIKDARKLLVPPPRKIESTDLKAARKYNKIATSLELRSRISCTVAFPKAGLFP